MKNAILLHGTGSTPKSFWFPSIKKHLENKGYSVYAPQIPNAKSPTLNEAIPFMLSNSKFNKDTILIGHSSGCPLILAILESFDIRIAKAILVAGFGRVVNGTKYPLTKDKYDWDKIKKNVKEIIFINSDDDPWGCSDVEGRYMFDKLGGTQIIVHGEGHFGSDNFNQPYRRFELLERLLH